MAEKPEQLSKFSGLLISNVKFTDTELGRGADATVYAVEWNGTTCAAKRLHEQLLGDHSAGGADRLLDNFERECLTWSKLRHPAVVQFLGVYFEPRSRLPVLVMEKMNTSLRRYLEDHSKKQFPFHFKVVVLRQVTQALAYLHAQKPSLVHHDLSPNNVLLNKDSFVTKVTDFGMSRAVNPFILTRKSSVKGTLAFMAPEALQDPPRYNETLDIFSFGNIILSTLTHEWPNPLPPTYLKGSKLVPRSELQRRERYCEMFTGGEKKLFSPIVRRCLENAPDKRPSSAVLVAELQRIEASTPKGCSETSAPQSTSAPARKPLAEEGKVQQKPKGTGLVEWFRGVTTRKPEEPKASSEARDTQTASTEPQITGEFVNVNVFGCKVVLSAPIHIKDFPEHVKNLHSNDDCLFSKEYKNVEPDHSSTFEAFSNPINAKKNRYSHIKCYDHSRVRLTPTEGAPGNYINANFLDGYKQPNAFIATQGPVPDSIEDFWQMVWEQDAPTIVMLTNLEDRGQSKCHRYWPTYRISTYGNITISTQEKLELSDYTIRTFSIIMRGCREERIVTQFHFMTWPDFGVPSHPTPLLLFIRRVKATHPSGGGPIVVHCSDGVGQTGTFITLHTQMSRIIDEQLIDVFSFVRSMRLRRLLMVQTEAQYIFIHDALLEVLECGITEVAVRELPSQYKLLQTVDEKTGKTLLELELQRLSETLHVKKPHTEADKPLNKGKNRYSDILPFDENRCRMTSMNGVPNSDYINASFIDGYLKKRAFIATQGPLPDTVADFWRMVWEYKCASIVMLTKEKEGSRVQCNHYWPDWMEMYGLIQVFLISENTYWGHIQREFKLINTKDKSSLPVRQFQFTGWPEESGKTPESGAELIDLIGRVQRWQRTSGDRPVVVHCSGGSGYTGTYIAIANLLDRLKMEGVVDVFQTVRALRLQRPCMVQTLEQYRYCYTTVLEYLES